MVAAWISAETGVGPAMASGSQVYSGIWADLPVQPRKRNRVMAVTTPLPAANTRRGPLHHPGEGQRPQRVPEQEHGDQEAEVADPVDDERLLAGVGVDLVAEPEADQQVGAEAHAFPADEHHREAGAQHQHQHEDHEEVEVREVPGVPRVCLHVPDAEQVDQAADPGDDQQHDSGELVDLERRNRSGASPPGASARG